MSRVVRGSNGAYQEQLAALLALLSFLREACPWL